MDILEHAKAPKLIDYLNLNVNGTEHFALEKFDFSKYTFSTITVERPPLKLHDLLLRHDYSYVYEITYMNSVLYVHKTLHNHAHVMKKYYISHHSVIEHL